MEANIHEMIMRRNTKQKKLDSVFMNVTKEIAQLSHCERFKVGAVLVKDGNIISFGYNGTPTGMDNCCEDKLYAKDDVTVAFQPWEKVKEAYPFVDGEDDFADRYRLITKDKVIHGEVNAILKAAKNGTSVDGATLYLTLSPCLDCSKLILQSGIKRVVYLNAYRNLEGVEFLKNFIKVEKYDNQ